MRAAPTPQKIHKDPHDVETAVVPQAQANGPHWEGQDDVPDASDDDDESVADGSVADEERLVAGVDSPNLAEDADTTDIIDTPKGHQRPALGKGWHA